MKLCLVFGILTSLITGVESCVLFGDSCQNGGTCIAGICDCTDSVKTGARCMDARTFDISRSPDSATVNEGSQPVLLTITRPPDKSNYAVTLIGTGVGSATPDDFMIEDAVFNVGDTSVQINLTITDDDLFEDEEQLQVSYTSSPLIVGPLDFTIPTNDPLTITDSRDAPFTESDGAVPLSFFIISQSQDPIDILLTITSSDASKGTDYTVTSTTINFNTDNWITILAAEITFLSDSIPEPHKSITFTFTSTTALNGDTAKTIAIMDDDDETMVMSGPSTVMENDGFANFSLKRGMAPTRAAVVTYTVTSNRPDLSSDSKKITEVLSKVELDFPVGGPMMKAFFVTLEDDALKEPDQTFTVDLFIESGLVAPIPSQTVTVTEDDDFGVTVEAVDVVEGSPITVILTRDSPKGELVVALSTADGSAIAGEDYTAVTAAVTFAVGVGTVELEIQTSSDNDYELDESLILTVTGSGYTLKSDSALSVIIRNDDALIYQLSIAVGPAVEGGMLVFQVLRNPFLDELDVTVSSVDGTAIAGTHFAALNKVVTFAANSNEMEVEVQIMNEEFFNLDRTFSLMVSSTAAMNPFSPVEVTINNDDDYGVTVEAEDVVEGAPIVVTLTRDSSEGELVVALSTADDSAIAGEDYTAVTAAVTFAVGVGTVELEIQTSSDNDYELDESLILTVTGSGYTLKSDSVRSVIIRNDDALIYQLSIAVGPAVEGGMLVFQVLRNPFMDELDVTVSSVDGTAIAGTHFAALNKVVTFAANSNEMEVEVQIMNEEFFNLDRTFSLMVSSTAAMNPFSPVEVTINNDDDYGVTVEAEDVVEGAPIVVTLTRDSSEGELVVALSTADDSAIAGEDYTALTTTVTFTDGVDTMELEIQTSSDNDYELDESLILTVTGSGYTLKSDTVRSVIIRNDDVEVLTLTVNPTVSESAGSIVATLTRTQSFEDLSVIVTTEMDTADSSDLSLTTPAIQSFGSATSLEINIRINEDTTAEPDETFVLKVDAPDPIVAVSADITILNDDPDTISVDTFLGAAENVGTKIVTLSRTVSMAELTVTIEATDGTAKEGSDFTIDPEATFEAGSLKATFVVTILDDDIEEDLVEVFSITISGSSSEVKGDVNADFKIADNEGSRPFDCRRKNQGCESNLDKCYNDYPFCDCVGGDTREGAMCNIVTDQKDGAGCPATCTENGQCLSNSGVVTCACKPGYFGDNCENYFLKAECSSSSMKLIVNPHGNFDGVIYVKEKLSESTCQGEDGADGFTIEVDHDSSICGEILPVEGVSETSYSRKFIIQYEKSILNQLDQCVTVSCKFDTDDVLVDSGVVTVDPNGPLTEESTSGLFSPVTLQILDIKGVPVTESMVVPISKKLCVTLSIPSAFGGLEMIDIEFNDTRKVDPKTLLVLSEGCETNTAKFVFSNPPFYVTPSNKKVLRFCFFAFQFVGIETLAVTMKVKICVDPDDCVATFCSAVRRKREAGGDTRTETLGTRFTISNTPQQNGSSQNVTEVETSTVRMETTCEYPSHYLPTIISLGVLVLLLVLLVLYLTYRLVRRPKKTLHPLKPKPWFRHYPTPFTPK